MIRRLDDSRAGFVNEISDLLSRHIWKNPRLAPALGDEDAVYLFSDYSRAGRHFATYSFLVCGKGSADALNPRRAALRSAFRLGRRRMAYKLLSDQLKFRALPAFLSLFDDLDAMLLTFAVDNRIQFMLAEQFLAVDTDFAAGVKRRVFEDMLRIAHFGAQTIATSFRPGQHVVWVTDSDDIVANERCEQIFGKVAGVVLRSFLRSETIGSLSFAVTSIPDPTLQLEDFTSVPDLVAGAVGETLSALAASGLHVTGGVCLDRPRVSGKTDVICQWLARESSLGKIGVVLEKFGSGVWDWRPTTFGIGRQTPVVLSRRW